VSSDLLFDFVKTSSILPSFGSGVYEVSVFVAAENAQSISRDFKWTWDGTLQGLKFTPRRHRHAWGLSTGWSGDKMGQ